ncbi:MAG: hypothetical protein HYU57_04500 [Micavibrio aeruginosavorus]|nr:hypothetical protein [Micavibrio aeruginosavorus]
MVTTPVIQPAPTEIIGSIFQPRTQQEGPDRMAELEKRMAALQQTTKGMVWKAADSNIDQNRILKNSEGFSHAHGQNKADAAAQMKQTQVAEIKDTLKEMTALGGGPAAEPSGSGLAGRMAGNLALDAAVTGAAVAVMGPVGGLVATAAMAARATGIIGTGLEGQGTLVTFNQAPGYFGSAPGRSKGGERNREASAYEAGYSTSSSMTAQTQQVSAPVTTAFQQKLNSGPGFGRGGDITARTQLAGDSLDQIAIKIADKSPAGKEIESMRLNAEGYAMKIQRAQKDGVDATQENVATATDMGMELREQGPKIQTFKMS